ncbi:aldose 1-epimerase [Clostridium felsineum]|uniref:Aldose 1-epimerase n=1 Tax=Clostridium felsineum TaxID=36839 RepID=A0A1S8LK77_9CLOT|nr:aldose 1-epimerase [Clostridium felsineum]MCR3760357.1 aldose 1-epimerase [Clostridium felsineum]URZ05413.1 Aldose 1-epimerase [Clostridium felsineum]URZ10454.1 Aldose 1-epimerase [Clostridium felsineum]URZ17620.1 Aldose 1-epimerase [Clostridium felsineum DSM 794]
MNNNLWIKEEILWDEHKCIRFAAGGYEALIIPDVGGNVVELKNNDKNVSVLRTPKEDLKFDDFKNRPQVYGLPVLFPPNRIEDGTFKVGERTYKFPINEAKNNNYIHGFIKNSKWTLAKKDIVEDKAVVEVIFDFNKDKEAYKYFPHEFQFKLSYELSKDGLKQTTSVVNLSSEEMPVSVGYHSAFNVPFIDGSKDSNCRVKISIDKFWKQDSRNLPTLESFEPEGEQKEFLNEGVQVSKHPIESLFSLKDIDLNGKSFRGACIEDASKNTRVVYEMSEEYKYLVIWNDMGDKNYTCIEPQSSIINSPNVKLDRSVSGFKTIKPNETWSGVCKLYVENM